MASAAIPELPLHQISRWCQQRIPLLAELDADPTGIFWG
jgi:hypothetical protein